MVAASGFHIEDDHNIGGHAGAGVTGDVVEKLIAQNRGLLSAEVLLEDFKDGEDGVEVDKGFGQGFSVGAGVEDWGGLGFGGGDREGSHGDRAEGARGIVAMIIIVLTL